VSWRRVPPVYSPVSLGSLAAGASVALGFARGEPEPVTSRLRQWFGPAGVVLTDSGTSALVLALRSSIRRGGTIALPGYACIDLIAASIFAGVSVRLYDLDPATLSPDLDSVRRALARGADAVLVAPLFGYPVDIDGVMSIAAQHGVPVIEDAAQAAGATFAGRRIGSSGAMTVLSFGRGKGTTGGSGGALLVRNPGTQEPAGTPSGTRGRGAMDVVKLAAQWTLARSSMYAVPASVPFLKLGEMVYHPAHEPRAPTAASLRIAAAALDNDSREVMARRERARQFHEAARKGERAVPIAPVAGGEAGYLRFAITTSAERAVARPDLGAVRAYPVTLDQHEATAQVLVSGEHAEPGAATLRDRLLTLPTHSRVSGADAQRLIAWLENGRDS